jgi:dephospho-CoA kinase
MTTPYLVALTGGMGSGKSAAAAHFSRLGAALVDSDAIARELSGAGGAATPLIAAAFGPDALCADGSVDRARMRALVFADPSARARLEAILHPLIQAESARRTRTASSPYVIIDIPLLVESGGNRHRHYDRVCTLDCPVALQIERVRARSGLDRSEIEAIIAAQASREARLAIADDVIDNAGTLDALHARVEALHARYLDLASRRLDANRESIPIA